MKKPVPFPVIDVEATGRNIQRLRERRGLSIPEVQDYLGLESPQSVYHWQRGRCLPSVDHLYALSALFGVTMNEILVPVSPFRNIGGMSPKSRSMILATRMAAA